MKRQRSNLFKWTIKAAVAVLLIFIIARLYYHLTDDFRLSNITYSLPYEKSWEVAEATPEQEKNLEQILDQPFYYLGKGAQSYAFRSEDNRYVLKFFKFKHLKPSFFLDALPSIGYLKTYKQTQAARKEKKLLGVFKSYKLAYEVDKEESGLIFVQLNTQNNPTRYVTVVDKIGIKRRIELHNYPFLVQEKGETLRTVIRNLLEKSDIETAQKRFGQILDLYAVEYEKGIYDHDHGIMQNTGFIDDRPFHLDVGKLMTEEKMRDKAFAKKDAELVIEKMSGWVKKYFPQHSSEIASYLNRKIDELF